MAGVPENAQSAGQQDPPVAAVVGDDAPCHSCGYNLRGMAREAKCPECGALVEATLRGELLWHSDPAWLDRLAFGATMKLWNILIMFVFGMGAAILASSNIGSLVVELLGLAGGCLGLWASFLITTQEPRITLIEKTVSLRRVIRTCASVALVGSAMTLADETTGLGFVLLILGTLMSLAGVVSAFGELIYFRRFAPRIPDPALAKSTHRLMWFFPICLGITFVVGFIGGIMSAAAGANAPGTVPGGVGFTALMGGVVCFGGIGLLVSLVWYISLLSKYRREFRTAAAMSRAVLAQPQA